MLKDFILSAHTHLQNNRFLNVNYKDLWNRATSLYASTWGKVLFRVL
jgi:hypothetical protein